MMGALVVTGLNTTNNKSNKQVITKWTPAKFYERCKEIKNKD